MTATIPQAELSRGLYRIRSRATGRFALWTGSVFQVPNAIEAGWYLEEFEHVEAGGLIEPLSRVWEDSIREIENAAVGSEERLLLLLIGMHCGMAESARLLL